MTIRHIVAWKLAASDAETRAAQSAEIKRLLEGLVGVVPSIRSLEVGVNVAYPETNGDVSLVCDFDDLAGLEEYQTHPVHVEAAGYIRSVVSGRVAVDYEV